MNVLLVAGGATELWPTIDMATFDYFVGIDRGSWHLYQKNWPLNLAIGDFDSLNATEKAQVFDYAQQVQLAPAEKDDTDTQLALAHIWAQFPTAQVTLIGATGGRLDHFLANLWLPLEPRFLPNITQLTLRDGQNTVTYYQAGTYTIHKEPQMKYLAYCNLTSVTDLALTGSKYTLAATDFSVPTSLASNEFVTETATLAFTSGIVAVIQSKD